MSYFYCVKVSPETEDDINLRFREAGLKGELFVTFNGEYYVCPQLSHSMWSMFPQSRVLPTKKDEQWDTVVSDCVEFLMENYSMTAPEDVAEWQNVSSSYRCPKMEAFVRENDLGK